MIESNNKKRQLIKIIKEHVIKNLNGYNYTAEFKAFLHILGKMKMIKSL